MAKQSSSWKDLERKIAKVLHGKRILRGDDFGESNLDVELKSFACDAKYRSKVGFEKWWDKLLADSKRIYKNEDKIPILVVKKAGRKGEWVIISLDDFVRVLKDGLLDSEEEREDQ